MTKPRQFGDPTQWGVWDQTKGKEGWSWGTTHGGWAMPSDPSRYISYNDSYWGDVLNRARTAYGDPNIQFNTDDYHSQRYLVFGDGTRLPTDGTVIYHDAANHRNWIQNDDGTVSLQDPNGGYPGPPIPISGYKPAGNGQFAPIDNRGGQIAPQVNNLGVQQFPTGYYTDPKTGIVTPKNANGDYYTIDPSTGTRHFFNKDNQTITEQQYTTPGAPAPPGAPPGTPPPPPGGPPPDSGQGADAIKKLEAALRNQNSTVVDADRSLAEAVLNAFSSTVQGKQKLAALQQEIEDAVNRQTALDTPMGAREFQKFLGSKQKEIIDVVASADLDDKSKRDILAGLGALYQAANPDQPAPGDDTGSKPNNGSPAGTAPTDGSPGPSAALPDGSPAGSNAPADGANAAGADPLASLLGGDPGLGGLGGLGSQMPQFPMPSIPSLGGLGGAGLPGLLGSGGAPAGGSPFADLLKPNDSGSDKKPIDSLLNDPLLGDPHDGTHDPAQPSQLDPNHHDDPTKPGDKPTNDQPTSGAPVPAPLAPPTPAGAGPTTVQLPNGQTITAPNPQIANAIKAIATGTPVDQAFRQNGITIPPPGAAVPNPLDPSQLTPGAIGQFTDHQVVALGKDLAIIKGQIQPISDAAGPGFLGWMAPPDVPAAPPPPTPATTTATPAPGTPAPVNPTPAPGSTLLTQAQH